MSRKKKHEEHENHERWLVSYADFITLLFAFFTVLYATARTDEAKLQAVVNGLNSAFEGGLPQAVLSETSSDSLPDAPLPPMSLWVDTKSDLVVQSLKRDLSGSLSDNTVQIGLVDQGLELVLPERLVFAAGSAELHPTAFPVLNEVADAIRGKEVTVIVTGHADATPVPAGSPFIDNWGLASARGAATARFLAGRGVAPEQMTVAGVITSAENPEERAVTIRVSVTDRALATETMDALGQ